MSFEPPTTENEETVAAVWALLLDRYPIGIHDEFLAVGGDSLLATRLLNRVVEVTGLPVDPVAFLNASTVAAQARLLDNHART
jgi:hypothetical protein